MIYILATPYIFLVYPLARQVYRTGKVNWPISVCLAMAMVGLLPYYCDSHDSIDASIQWISGWLVPTIVIAIAKRDSMFIPSMWWSSEPTDRVEWGLAIFGLILVIGNFTLYWVM